MFATQYSNAKELQKIKQQILQTNNFIPTDTHVAPVFIPPWYQSLCPNTEDVGVKSL
jgi:hypothetical protein